MKTPRVLSKAHLIGEQYRDASNLNARVRLHERFSVNPYGWQRWVFDHLRLPPASSILELGCGPGFLWRDNLERIPATWRVTLSDLSPGMAAQAEDNLLSGRQARAGQFTFQVIDAQAIPLQDGRFHAVIANHMLYFMPDLPKALAEIRRVLKPGGLFLATTIGRDHMRELKALIDRLAIDTDNLALLKSDLLAENFGLENGRQKLAPWFSHIERRLYEDALVVTEVEPLVAYVRSSSAWSASAGQEAISALTRLVEEELATQGAIHIAKSSGLFTARRT